jgi:hypothetical protein
MRIVVFFTDPLTCTQSCDTCGSQSIRRRSVPPRGRRKPNCSPSTHPHPGVRGVREPRQAGPIRSTPAGRLMDIQRLKRSTLRSPPACMRAASGQRRAASNATRIAYPPGDSPPTTPRPHWRRSRGPHHVRSHQDRPRLDLPFVSSALRNLTSEVGAPSVSDLGLDGHVLDDV